MFRKTFAFLTIFGLGVLASIQGAEAAKVEIALEAELANKIQAPMQISALKDAEKWQKIDEPSGGKFIWAPGAPLAGGGGQGFAEFILNLPAADTYAIWGKVIAWDGNSDSFWVTVQPADPNENPQQTNNFEFRWATRQGAFWHWDRVNKWLDAGTFDRQWKLPKGEIKITIWTREDATMLDCLFITTNIDPNEAAAGVRTPTADDVRKQKAGIVELSVQPKDKLATEWGRMKVEKSGI